MSFLNIPLKTIQVSVTGAIGTDTMPWYNPLQFPVVSGSPAPSQQFYRWRVVMDVTAQTQSSYLSRQPGVYNGYDITVGQWIANATTGQAWQIISIEAASSTQVTAIVQDIFRYNTFRDGTQTGNGAPGVGVFYAFNLSEDGLPQIDPVPAAGVSASFTQNLTSRFSYINLQYDYPLYQANNTFAYNDVIAIDPDNHRFVLADSTYKTVVGRVTSISDTVPGWFTVNPVNKIVDFLDSLPGNVGDTVYTSTTDPGKLTLDQTGTQIFIKLRNETSSITTGTLQGPTTANNVFSLNGTKITVLGSGSATDVVTAVNLQTAATGVSAELALAPTSAQSTLTLFYGEVAIDVSAATKPFAYINGIKVTFTTKSTTPGYENYAQAAQMAADINAANIPNVTASTIESGAKLKLVNSSGAAINITNGQTGAGGEAFAGPNSATGIPLSTPASTTSNVKLTAVDSRPISLIDVVGSTTTDFGLTSVENGTKAAGLYIQGGLRSGTSNNPASITVVTNLAALNALTPLVGDQAYVIDSDDGNGNNVGNWSMWIYDGSQWVVVTTQDSATSSAKTIKSDIAFNSPVTTTMASIPSKSRVTLVTVEVTTPFTGTPTMTIGYKVLNTAGAVVSNDGLMTSDLIDLNVAGTYTTSTNVLFGTTTVDGDVELLVKYTATGATAGAARVIISYV